MMKLSKIAIGVSIASSVLLTGCAGTHSPKTQRAMDRAEGAFDGGFEQQRSAYKPVRDKIGLIKTGQAYHDINNYVLIEKDNRKLPEAFESTSFVHDENGGDKSFTIDEFSAMIFEAYGVVVDVSSSDLMLLDKTSDEEGKLPLPPSAQAGNQGNGVNGDSTGNFDAISSILGQTSQGKTDRDNLMLKKFSYQGDLKGLLDYVTKLNGIKWKYDPESQRAFMYMYDTKMFNIYDFGDKVELKSNVTTRSSQDSESTSGGSNNSFSRETSSPGWDSVEENINTFLSNTDYSKATFDKKTGLISVTDTDFNLSQIKSYIDDLNKSTSTEIVVEFKIIRFTYSDKNYNGINQNVLNNKLQNNLFGSFDLEFGAGSLSPSISGNLGAFQELVQGNFLSIASESHEFLMGFLNTVGTAEVAYETQVAITNNDVFSDQEQRTQEYISSIERDTAGASATVDSIQSISTERDEAIDGISISLQPRITGDNIEVKYSVSNSDFLGLEDAGLGAGFEGVKLKTQDALNLNHKAKVLNGVPKVIKFTHRTEESTSSQGFFDDGFWFFGGNEKRDESKGATIVTVAAYYNN